MYTLQLLVEWNRRAHFPSSCAVHLSFRLARWVVSVPPVRVRAVPVFCFVQPNLNGYIPILKTSLTQKPDEKLLIWRMVRALDVDLAYEIHRERLSVERLSSMLKNCAHCPEPQACRLYLEARGDKAAVPPSFCPNRVVLTALGKHS